jgi:hypothetical protein
MADNTRVSPSLLSQKTNARFLALIGVLRRGEHDCTVVEVQIACRNGFFGRGSSGMSYYCHYQLEHIAFVL